jgi:diketogulonate reductase-like aldo/keto reductase
VLIRWVLQHAVVAIPKSAHKDRIIENSQVFDFELTAEEMAILDGLDRGQRSGPNPDALWI